MKNLVCLWALMLAVAAPAAFANDKGGEKDAAVKWDIDRSHSTVSFTVRHFFTPVIGKFKTFVIDLNFDPANVAESAVTAEIDVNSVDTGSENRDNHLKNPDFFEAEKYPKMTFKSTSITKTGENSFLMKGSMTIKEVTKEVEIPFTLLGIQDDPQREGMQRAGFEGSFKMNRLDYGVGTGNWVATTVVADELTVNLFLSVRRQK